MECIFHSFVFQFFPQDFSPMVVPVPFAKTRFVTVNTFKIHLHNFEQSNYQVSVPFVFKNK